MYKKVLVPFDDSESARRGGAPAPDRVQGAGGPQVPQLNEVVWGV